MPNQARFTITSLLEGKSAVVQITPLAGEGTASGTGGPGFHSSKGLGLEIDNVAALPDAEDYAQHEFYRANFTTAEISYCIKQPSVKAAFQGLAAAKRAIIKSGAAAEPAEGYLGIEVGFDGEGRPTYPGCLISISGTGTIAAAVCVWPAGLGWPAAALSTGTARPVPMVIPLRSRILAMFVLLSLLVLFALGLWKILDFGLR
ncbi:MAG: hypothetical protein L0Y57_10130 [Beijerinckiaceae bacterium]|nr:hypothetical protein [Beijerinckiaceae bacterium]